MELPRIYHRARAFLTGYFWLPCPNCGRMFGGHEEGGGNLWHTMGEGLICCPRCPTEKLQNGGILYDPSSYHLEVTVDENGNPTGPPRYVYGQP